MAISASPTWLATFSLTFVAAACFYAAMAAPIADRSRAIVAVAGIVLDWTPVAAGWMHLETDPPAVLWWAHMGFGVVGYAILVYCLAGWFRGRPRGLPVRLAFLAIWTPAYLAGIVMTVSDPSGL